jgi:lysophospholipase L1-like esterase
MSRALLNHLQPDGIHFTADGDDLVAAALPPPSAVEVTRS